MNTYAEANAVVAVMIMALVLVGLVVALERNHRRTAHLPRAPFGTDVEGDADLARIRAELASARRHEPAQSSGSSSRASQVASRSTAVSNSGWVSVNS